MSRRLRTLNGVLRHVVKPRLDRTPTPERAARDFDMAAPVLFRRPPFVRHFVRPDYPLALNWISAGICHQRRLILYFHGGAYLAGSARTHLGLLARLSKLSGVEVCAPDYRLSQDAPFPAAFDDAVAAWQVASALGYRPQDIVLGGDSAGGGLMLALLAYLTRRGQRPAAAFAFSAWTDLTLSGESLRTNARRDPLLPAARLPEVVEMYLGGSVPAHDPRASPLFARFDRPPPVLLQVGGDEILLDDTLRMAGVLELAGGRVTLDMVPEVPHVWQIFDGWIPEARVSLRQTAQFVQAALSLGNR